MADVEFHPTALREYQAAIHWYQQQNPGTARRFVAEIERVLAQVRAQPDRFGWYDDHFHEAILKRFPYHVVYQVEESGNVLIIAIAHSSRQPDYWKNRTDPTRDVGTSNP